MDKATAKNVYRAAVDAIQAADDMSHEFPADERDAARYITQYNTALAALMTIRDWANAEAGGDVGTDRGVDLAAITGLKPEAAPRQAERGPVEGNSLVGKEQPQK